MDNRIKKSLQIKDSQVKINYDYDTLFEAEIKGENDTYYVWWDDGLWRCDCEDYQFRGVNKPEGSFICKHILKVIQYLQKNEECC